MNNQKGVKIGLHYPRLQQVVQLELELVLFNFSTSTAIDKSEGLSLPAWLKWRAFFAWIGDSNPYSLNNWETPTKCHNSLRMKGNFETLHHKNSAAIYSMGSSLISWWFLQLLGCLDKISSYLHRILLDNLELFQEYF